MKLDMKVQQYTLYMTWWNNTYPVGLHGTIQTWHMNRLINYYYYYLLSAHVPQTLPFHIQAGHVCSAMCWKQDILILCISWVGQFTNLKSQQNTLLHIIWNPQIQVPTYMSNVVKPWNYMPTKLNDFTVHVTLIVNIPTTLLCMMKHLSLMDQKRQAV